ncbi:fucose isomerase [Quadrisphaera setariae]|uniref:Fucose isomerase n=1 Tax=Quadrisphaera setariae TaxID=2593304 RepID=A0A5C8ZJG7_9ACTN|nr:fucose isomerase [Quadrisphaera setariae]TXR58007.1 fucose isomerase [Quadrisphaera setariae]
MTYALPTLHEPPAAADGAVYLVASGDLRESANTAGWGVQQQLEAQIGAALAQLGRTLVRAHDVDPSTGHGFISSQRMGLEVFRSVPPTAPLVVAEAVWQYSHHVLAGLRDHRGPILVAGNWEPDWPGLVGMLNLNGSLAKAGIAYSTLWSKDWTDDYAVQGLRTWLATGELHHDASHVRALPALADLPDSAEKELGTALARQLRTEKAIIGVFDEGCMGMYNAIFDDELLNAIGVYKERLSQSALWAEMQTVSDAEADEVGHWLKAAGMTFRLGSDEATELTEAQLTWQHKMYVAAVRIADDFGCDAIGIQYQQGLKDLCPASDLVEGLLNNVDRPPVTSRDGSRVLFEGRALPHFNEVDEGVAVDSLVTNRVWTAMGLDPATTLHDVRWGEYYDGMFVWTFEISGSVPPSHLGGYPSAEGWRQDPVFFPAGGSTIRGVSKPGEVVWSRVYLAEGQLQVDLGRAHVVALPKAETERRWAATNPEWPIAHVVMHGTTRNQFMGRHKANHANIAYAPDVATADRALLAKATAFAELGLRVHLCGDVPLPA